MDSGYPERFLDFSDMSEANLLKSVAAPCAVTGIVRVRTPEILAVRIADKSEMKGDKLISEMVERPISALPKRFIAANKTTFLQFNYYMLKRRIYYRVSAFYISKAKQGDGSSAWLCQANEPSPCLIACLRKIIVAFYCLRGTIRLELKYSK